MKKEIETNFFWRGDDFQFLNRLTILSHLIVGHKVKIWLSGSEPKSKYWIDDIKDIQIENADDIADIDTFLKLPRANVRTAASLFRFKYLYKFGGLYCDTDMVALKKFPDNEWIIVSYDDNVIAIGIIKAPKEHPLFVDCIKKIQARWGNVYIFTKYCGKHRLKKTHPNNYFYPKSVLNKGKGLLKNTEIPNSYSIHLYFNGASNKNIDHNTIKKYPDSLLAKLQKKVFQNYSLFKR